MACDLILQSSTWVTIKSVFAVDYVVDPSQKVKMNHFFQCRFTRQIIQRHAILEDIQK